MSSAASRRQLLYLARQRQDLCVLPTLVPKTRIIEVLLAEGLLSNDEPSRKELSDAFSKWAFAKLTRQEQELWPEL